MLPGSSMNFPRLIADFAVEAVRTANPKPYGGYIARLEEYPEGDGYKTNFRFVAEPAPGYTGKIFWTDKTGKIIEK